ncbi:MAG: hypothetical protein HKN43_08205 [Rhodothermales bacterium]|nr:hypothetical protein [Rhodothermales bacterium]
MAWVAAILFLVAIFVAMQFTDEVNWTAGDFLIAGFLLFGSLGVYEIATRANVNTAYRAGVGVAVLAAFLMIWVNGAVGITDSDADGMYIVVVAIGVIGAFIARFKARGMWRAMLVTAVATALVGISALIAGIVPSFNTPFEILAITAFFVVLYGGSALLFRNAISGDG